MMGLLTNQVLHLLQSLIIRSIKIEKVLYWKFIAVSEIKVYLQNLKKMKIVIKDNLFNRCLLLIMVSTRKKRKDRSLAKEIF